MQLVWRFLWVAIVIQKEKLECIQCHARMHGLIHDGRLRACQSCLLGLMYVFRLLYVIKCFRVMTCLGFQLVDGCMKGQVLRFSC